MRWRTGRGASLQACRLAIPCEMASRPLLAAIALNLALLASCGSVGHPLPPLVKIPARVENLEAWQQSEQINASWTWPRFNTEGEVLGDLVKFELYSLELAPNSPAPPEEAFEDHARMIRSVEADSLTESGPGLPVTASAPVEDRGGRRMAYAVRAISARDKVSPWSAAAIVDLVAPAPPPASPDLSVQLDGVRISWEPVKEASGYVVEKEVEGLFLPLGESGEPELLDTAIAWDSPHSYRIRSIVPSGARPVQGEASEASTVTPTDTFAPAAPRDLRAIVTPGSIELSWTANEEDDLFGYRIRRNGELHEGIIGAASFSDPAEGDTIRYTVSAVDHKGNESAESETIEVNR